MLLLSIITGLVEGYACIMITSISSVFIIQYSNGFNLLRG